VSSDRESNAVEERRAFRRGVHWNVASLTILGLSGFAMLGAIERLFDTESLGRFQLVWGVYVILSQLAVGGLDRSVLHSVAAARHDRERLSATVWSALVPGAVLSFLAAVAMVLLREPLAALLRSPALVTGLTVAAPGLFCFGVNKVLLGVVNGLQRMRAFAVYQSLRYALMPAGVVVVHAAGLSGDQVPLLFLVAEGTLLLALLVELARTVGAPTRAWTARVGTHLRYGIKSVLAGVILELNTRLDVLMLGVFLASDGPVGIYSLAVMVAEGIFQLVVVLQNNYNPVLARHLATGERDALAAVVRRGKLSAWAAFALVGAVAIALFPFGARVLMGTDAYQEAWLPFAILMGAIVLVAGWLPFGQILLMGNRPGWHSGMMVLVLVVNAAANAALIPLFGLPGAALGTGLSFVASVTLTRWFSRRVLRFAF
jgi:stage V sporulation protein B